MYHYRDIMIPFKSFWRVYLRYFITMILVLLPCCYLYELIQPLYEVNITIFAIILILLMFCCVGCYKWIWSETLLDPYDKLVVNTKFDKIPWKFALYFFKYQ